MKQIVQNLGNGSTVLRDVPAPSCSRRHVQIRNSASLISLGTEKMLVEFGQASLIEKARKQPDKVKVVLEKAKTDGIATTISAVKSKLNQPIPMGYCSAGTVITSVDTEFAAGDRVVSNGPHAEVVAVSRNLVAHIPDNVSFEAATFTPVAAIGLQGIRLAAPQIGETVVVIGLGLIGLLVVQMLKGQGCNVIGFDFDSSKIDLAREYGAAAIALNDQIDPVAEVMSFTNQNGADAVIVTASTQSSEPMKQAAHMSRKRGKIILVGVTGLNLSRADLYEKELTLQVSCSYGPGRYDTEYENRGNDYPYAYVRWTEQRNFEATLRLMSTGVINVDKLISSTYPLSEAVDIYKKLGEDKSALGVVIQYDQTKDESELVAKKVVLRQRHASDNATGAVVAGVLGAGNYASRVLIPAMKKARIGLHTIVAPSGVNASHHGIVNNFQVASSDNASVLDNPEINLAVIATRHDSHASLVCEALEAGKHVFVEKPLALNHEELDQIETTWNALDATNDSRLMVGFNRRYAPLMMKLKSLIASVNEPKCVTMTMNAGIIPADSWVQSTDIGGGRIIGEACHLIDLSRHLVGHEITSIYARGIGKPDSSGVSEDKATITLGFADGSIATIHYFANGDKAMSKERFEVFAGGRVLTLDNFRRLTGYGWSNFKKMSSMKQDKGQDTCIADFAKAIAANAATPIPMSELLEVSRAAIDAAQMIRDQT